MNSLEVKKALKYYNSVEKILSVAKQERWPYPKTFDLLQAISVKSYTVKFIDGYNANYYDAYNAILYKEEPPEGYRNLKAAKQFSAEGVKNAIVKHMRDKTTFLSFLEEIANVGSSHYVVNMEARTVAYYNNSEDQFHIEQVPTWNWE